MDSTNHNLENPTKVDILRIVKDVNSHDFPTVKLVSQEFYDLGQNHDPHTIYCINNSPDMRVYYGDILVLKPRNRKQKYFLTILDDGTYSISLNQVNGHHDNLIEICRFDDPKKAMDTLRIFNRIGFHQMEQIRISNMIASYSETNISCHDLIIGIMNELGYKEDPRLQQVIMAATIYGATSKYPYLPDDLVDMIKNQIKSDPSDPVYKVYYEIYKVVLKYGFADIGFRTKDVINDIINITMS